MIRIESPANDTYKAIKSLKERKFRDSLCEYIVEGLRISQECANHEAFVKYICISDTFIKTKMDTPSTLRDNNIFDTISKYENRIISMPDKLFNDICDTTNPQGILCVMNKPTHVLADTLTTLSNSCIVLLESVQDPGNMGTIIRTADAANVAAIIVSPGCVDVYSPKVIRSTMGSIFHIPVIHSTNFHSDILTLKANKTKIFAAHLEGELSIFETQLVTPLGNTGILIGNEANGILDETASLANMLVFIPMPGKAESLNASTAAAIIIYEALRQKKYETTKNVVKSY